MQDALASPTALAMAARKMGFPAVALTDHGRMGGCIEFFEGCTKPVDGLDPIKPILGVEMYVVPDRFDKNMVVDDAGNKRRRKTFHLTLMAKNLTGYRNLLAMCSIGAQPECYHYVPRVDWEVISQHHEGVLCFTGCLGSEVNQRLIVGDEEGAREVMTRYKDVFGDDYYGELQYHGIDIQKRIMPVLKGLCKDRGMKMVCSNDVHYIEQADWKLHDVLIHMRDALGDDASVKVSGKREAYATHEFYLKDEAAMHRIFDKLQEDAVHNTMEVADKVENFMHVNVPHMLPKAEIPTGDQSFLGYWKQHYPHHQPNEAYLAYLATNGLQTLGLSDDPAYKQRLKYELSTVWHMGVTDYFLIQRELATFMQQGQIRFGIRGSGVASLVNYCIGVSDIDPVKWNLMFERFLNPGRGTNYKVDFPEMPAKAWLEEHGKQNQTAAIERLKSVVKAGVAANPELKHLVPAMQKELWVLENQKLGTYVCDLADTGFKSEKNAPNLWSAYFMGITDEKPTGGMHVGKVAALPDVDTDIDDRYRDTAIEWAKRRFGEDHVAVIGNWGTYGLKAAVTGCLKSSPRFQAKFGEKTHVMAQSISKSIEEQPSHVDNPEDPLVFALKNNPSLQRWVNEFSEEFEAANKMIGVVSNLGVHAAGIVIASEPIAWHAPIEKSNKGPVTAYDMANVEKLGLVKYDFLGLAMHQKIDRALKYIKERHGKDIDLLNIPMDDPRIFGLFNNEKTTTLFQFSSPGMRKALREVQVSSVEDLIAIVALFRPGPMAFIPNYAELKRNPGKVSYPHEIIEKHLGVTYGIPVYQEQVMLVCRDMAGFDHDEVDAMRKAVSKKDPVGFDKVRKMFREKATKTMNVNPAVVDATLDSWKAFAGYAFNRAHACSYALLAYRGAYLRVYYPVEWLAACMETDISGNRNERVAGHRAECDEERPRISVYRPDVNMSKMQVHITDEDVIVLPLTYIKNVGASGKHIAEHAPYADLRDFVLRGEPSRQVLRNLAEADALRSLPDCKGKGHETIVNDSEKHFAELESLKKEAKKDAKRRYDSLSPLARKPSTLPSASRPLRPAGKPFGPKPKASILDSFE
ncbi:MAG: DNA polymerase III subunit alpha [Armatimonadetes bacterium]|nr:DNA polymerase III subunit alpha [Armatimonadota bacterium]